MSHLASSGFWKCYESLPAAVQELTDRNFALLQAAPSLYFKKVGLDGEASRHSKAVAMTRTYPQG